MNSLKKMLKQISILFNQNTLILTTVVLLWKLHSSFTNQYNLLILCTPFLILPKPYVMPSKIKLVTVFKLWTPLLMFKIKKHVLVVLMLMFFNTSMLDSPHQL